MSMDLVDKYITQTFRDNRVFTYILAFFILILIATGIILGVLISTGKIAWWFELFIVPVLGCLIRYYAVVTKNNPEILDKASGALDVAKNQDVMAPYLREERESEKQKGG